MQKPHNIIKCAMLFWAIEYVSSQLNILLTGWLRIIVGWFLFKHQYTSISRAVCVCVCKRLRHCVLCVTHKICNIDRRFVELLQIIYLHATIIIHKLHKMQLAGAENACIWLIDGVNHFEGKSWAFNRCWSELISNSIRSLAFKSSIEWSIKFDQHDRWLGTDAKNHLNWANFHIDLIIHAPSNFN